MPTILPPLLDPTDRMVQGQQLRVPTESVSVESFWSPLILDPIDRPPMLAFSQVTLPYETGMMEISTRRFSARVPQPGEGRGIRNNACIATPSGAIIAVPMADECPIAVNNEIGQSTIRFALSGITKDSAGAALGSCRVIALETGRLTLDHPQAEVGETISDGSGSYTVNVPMNTGYQVVAYKAGSPDVAGITRNDVTPVPIG